MITVEKCTNVEIAKSLAFDYLSTYILVRIKSADDLAEQFGVATDPYKILKEIKNKVETCIKGLPKDE